MTESTEEFRLRARGWLAEHAPSFPRADESGAAARVVQAQLFASGFAGISRPKKYGGQGLSEAEQRAWDEETQKYDLPLEQLGVTLAMVVPTLLDLGTEEHKTTWVPAVLRGEKIACQLFSEPDAGSDVAGLRTRAVRNGEGWVVNGQKVWTSHAHIADFGLLLARTNPDAPKHKGITMFVVDMRAAGIEVRPLKDMTGASKFNEVFFDNLTLPADAVVGEVDSGWAAAVQMLKYERLAITSRIKRHDDPSSYVTLAGILKADGPVTDPAVRRALAEVFVGERVGELFSARLAEEVKQGIDPGARGSIGKLASARQVRTVAAAVTTMLGSRATAWDAEDATGEALAHIITSAPRYRLAGGTDEIQRNIIGEHILGLPKEPS